MKIFYLIFFIFFISCSNTKISLYQNPNSKNSIKIFRNKYQNSKKEYKSLIFYPNFENKKINKIIQEKLKKYKTFINQDENIFINADFKLSYLSEEIVSFKIIIKIFVNNEHNPYIILDSLNINLKQEKEIYLKDLFIKDFDYKSFFNKKIKEKLANAKFIDKFVSIEDNQDFYIEDRKINLFFQSAKYDIYSNGILEINLDIETINKYLIKKI